MLVDCTTKIQLCSVKRIVITTRSTRKDTVLGTEVDLQNTVCARFKSTEDGIYRIMGSTGSTSKLGHHLVEGCINERYK